MMNVWSGLLGEKDWDFSLSKTKQSEIRDSHCNTHQSQNPRIFQSNGEPNRLQ